MGRLRTGGGVGSGGAVPAIVTDFFDVGLRAVSIRAEDFRESDGTTSYAWQGWTVTSIGAGAQVISTGAGQSATRQGLISLATGTTTTGNAQTLWKPTGANTTLFASGMTLAYECAVRIPVLSGGGQDYYLNIGYANAATGVTEALLFQYAPTVFGNGNWHATARNGGVTTSLDLAVPVSTDWVRLGLDWDGAQSSYIIDGIAVGNINTNLPVASISPVFVLGKQGGTASRECLVDYVWERILWNPPR